MKRWQVVLAIAWAVVAVSLTGPVRASDDPCVTARVDGPILLPDGSEHPAGRLTVCGAGSFSPVSHLQRAAINGRSVGIYLSSPRVAEVPSEGPPIMTFVRVADGRLLLVGYALPSGSNSVAYVFEESWRLIAAHRVASPWGGGGMPLTMVAAAR